MLDQALGWVGKVAEWFGQFIPRREILDTTEGAVKYSGFVLPLWLRARCGGFKGDFRVTTHGPGVHWWWPYTSKWSCHPVARQTDRLETQTFESKDGKTFMASATVTYEVVKLEDFVTRIHSQLTFVVDTSMLAVHDVCCGLDWDELQAEQRKGTLKTKLKNAAERTLGEYGLKVHKLQLNSLARCRVLKVSQSVASEEN